jgi:hypothetical protein
MSSDGVRVKRFFVICLMAVFCARDADSRIFGDFCFRQLHSFPPPETQTALGSAYCLRYIFISTLRYAAMRGACARSPVPQHN